jgi:adenosylcobinamide-phosphate synthase
MRSGNGGQVAAALLLDALFGEPPEAVHPTVLMGRSISAFERTSLKLEKPGSRRLAGIALALLLPTLVFVSTRKVLDAAPARLRLTIGTALISTTLSMRGLAKAAGNVEHALRERRLEEARTRVGHFVGRDTEDLSEPEVCRAAVESVAENTSDGVVAPMLYGLLFGAPGALAYKAVNTLDSMVGHPQFPHTELGWASARLDDLANLLPSRLTALAVAAVSGSPFRTLRIANRYGPLTKSPNAGMAEAAFAGALGVRLGGTNTYGGVLRKGPTLGDGRLPESDDIRGAVNFMRRCCVLLGLLALLKARAGRG